MSPVKVKCSFPLPPDLREYGKAQRRATELEKSLDQGIAQGNEHFRKALKSLKDAACASSEVDSVTVTYPVTTTMVQELGVLQLLDGDGEMPWQEFVSKSRKSYLRDEFVKVGEYLASAGYLPTKVRIKPETAMFGDDDDYYYFNIFVGFPPK